MLLLVTDTSGKDGSVALVRSTDDSGELHLIESAVLSGGAFSAQLVPQISALLEHHDFNKTDIRAFLVISGPGSFTGLRVGLAAIKALAEVLGKPIVPISLLQVLALAAGKQGRVLAALDAGRGEIYAGEYEIRGESAHLVSERLISKQELLTIAKDQPVSTTDANLAEHACGAGLAVVRLQPVTAQQIAIVGWTKLRAGQTVSPEQLEANYIRRTDAEIFAKPASSA